MNKPLAPNPSVTVGNVVFSNAAPLSLIAGPCQLESRQHAFDMAGALKELTGKLGIGLVYKTSYDKANRTSLSGARGAGLDAALPVFDDLRMEFALPILTDVHTDEQCALVAPHVDILQIPAFLSRQTDLLIAAALTGKVVNVKKGQFLAPWDMKNVVAKVTGSGGERRFVETLSRAAVAVGVAGVFIETHQDPDNAPSDGPNMVPLKDLRALLERLMAFDRVAKGR
ncbi:MAG: 3-deoxy-8-phosphooctulonate synthase [Mesorhizobium sp.]|nr:MAG: 3-deoxy-8-phosphooctulonate synthase [Mesorhizobium sp.]